MRNIDFSGSRIFPASIGTWAKASAGSSMVVCDSGIWSILACIIGFIREPDLRRCGAPDLFPRAHAARPSVRGAFAETVSEDRVR